MNNAPPHTAEREPERLVAEFLHAFRASGIYRRDHIARLAELATAEDAEIAEPASAALFASLVERLADSFLPGDVTLYNRVFAQIIAYGRTLERSHALDQKLASFNLHSEADLIARAASCGRLQSPARWRDAKQNVRRVIALSRVTLGADVAVTSVIIERMKREFPDAEMALVGGRKAPELFGGDTRLTFKEISYYRAGTTIERLRSWLDVLDAVREMTGELQRGEFLIVDPDSRLTQLGLLPLARAAADYLFFPSREYGSESSDALGQLTARWLDEVFGEPQPTTPRLSLARADTEPASHLTKRLRQSRARPIIAINFGIGENPMKRIGDDFELSLVAQLIQHGATVILDKGAGADETRRADAIIRHAIEDRAARVIELDEQSLPALLQRGALDTEMIVWQGRIGMLAALIAESDLYIGYDSAGQHIAAALGVPCIDVFAGYSAPRMLARWRPSGQAETRVIAVDTLGGADTSNVLAEVLRQAREMISKVIGH